MVQIQYFYRKLVQFQNIILILAMNLVSSVFDKTDKNQKKYRLE